MIYITQLIYLKPGKEEVFDEFEAVAIPLIYKYDGVLLFRIRPEKSNVIAADERVPYEIHLVKFPGEDNFHMFMKDEERKNFLHLKEQSIESVVLIKGNTL